MSADLDDEIAEAFARTEQNRRAKRRGRRGTSSRSRTRAWWADPTAKAAGGSVASGTAKLPAESPPDDGTTEAAEVTMAEFLDGMGWREDQDAS